MSTRKASAEATNSDVQSISGWKAKLIQAQAMMGQAGEAAYDRVKLLVEVFDDREWRASVGNVDDFDAAGKLDEFVEDLCLDFLSLRGMLKHFPKRQKWASGKLATMFRECKAENSQPGEKKRRNRVSLEDYARVKAEVDKWKGKAREINEELTTAKSRITELERENDALRQQLGSRQAA